MLVTCLNCYECHKKWAKERVIEVPYKKGIARLHIQRIVRAATVNGLPIDLLITGHASVYSESIEFGVLFSETPPPAKVYPLPVLWRQICGPLVGEWVAPRNRI